MNKSDIPEVTSEKIYLSNCKINQEGLLSEVIFGTTRDYKCACGNYSFKHIYGGKTCPECGVTCESSDVRYEKFGKIILPVFVINTFEKSEFKKITGKYFKNFLNPNQHDLISSINIYLSYDQINDKISISENYTTSSLPIKITGIYSLYLGLVTILTVYGSKNAEKYISFFYNELLVVPPETRIVLSLNNFGQKIIRHKITDLYVEIIRNKKYIEKDKIDIQMSFETHLKKLINLITSKTNLIINDQQIVMFDSFTSRFQYYSDLLYSEILNVLSRKNGIIRSDFLGKNIDFSARAIVINDPSLPTHQIKIPKKAFLKLWFLEYVKYINDFKFSTDKNNFISQNFLKYMLQQVTETEYTINFDQYEHFDDFVTHFFNNTKQKERLIYINRQPTLWRYGLFNVEIVGLNEEDVISVSPMLIHSLNMDFDGDTAALYKVHDSNAINECYENSFIMNLIEYDHNDQFLVQLTNENKYIYEVLKSCKINDKIDHIIEIENVLKLKYNYKINIHTPVYIKDINKKESYGIVLLNKWASINDIKIDNTTSSEQALKLIYKHSSSNEKFHYNLKKFVSSLYWFLSTHQEETLTLPFVESCEFIHKVNQNELLNKLPENQYLGHYIYSAVVDHVYKNIPKNSQLYKLTKSKFKKTQFSRCLVSIGYLADNNNKISPTPVRSNILSGLTEDEFFETSFGTRKGLVDKERNVPESGYMQRSMVINLSSLEIVEDDCNTKYGFKIKIQNKIHNRSLVNRYYFNESNGKTELYTDNDSFNDDNIGKTFVFRSPITCQTSNFKLCKKCVGEQKFKSPYIGVMTGQYIEERLTQLTMSSFHTSGSATIELDEEIKNYFENNLINIKEFGNQIILTFKNEVDFEIIKKITSTPQFKFNHQISNNILVFDKYYNKIDNEDVGKIIKKVNKILSNQNKKNLIPIETAYYETIDAIHRVSNLYSIFIEILFANIYVNKNNKILRYALKDGEDPTPYKKYNIKSLHKLQSNTLSLLYEPNKSTILNYHNSDKNENDLNIFEKIWVGKI